MRRILTIAFFTILAVNVAFAQTPRTKSPAGASVYIIAPQDGEVVEGPVNVKFGLQGMGVAPAGIDYPDSGHHHLLINADEMPPMDQPLPADENHVHFGKGQTETVLDLEPGTYTLQLVLGDKNHIPHDPPVVSERITVVVK